MDLPEYSELTPAQPMVDTNLLPLEDHDMDMIANADMVPPTERAGTSRELSTTTIVAGEQYTSKASPH